MRLGPDQEHGDGMSAPTTGPAREPGDVTTAAARPGLIVVSGRPGAGKTTLAHAVARGVGCPAVCRDEIREGIVHAGTPDPEMRHTFETFFAALRFFLNAGVTVVAEAAFQDHLWRPNLTPLAATAEIRVIRCEVDPALARERMISRRAADPVRAIHQERDVPVREHAPIAMDVPTLVVDTTDGYSPALPAIVSFAAGRSTGR